MVTSIIDRTECGSAICFNAALVTEERELVSALYNRQHLSHYGVRGTTYGVERNRTGMLCSSVQSRYSIKVSMITGLRFAALPFVGKMTLTLKYITLGFLIVFAYLPATESSDPLSGVLRAEQVWLKANFPNNTSPDGCPIGWTSCSPTTCHPVDADCCSGTRLQPSISSHEPNIIRSDGNFCQFLYAHTL